MSKSFYKIIFRFATGGAFISFGLIQKKPKPKKRSRLRRPRYSGERLRCRLRTRCAQTADAPAASSSTCALRSPDEAFTRTQRVLWGWPIPPGEAFGSSLIRALLLLLQSNRLIISTGDCIRDCYRDVIGGTFCCTILGKQDGSSTVFIYFCR